MAGWVLRNAAMVQVRPGLVGMVFNSALCFALVGVALLLPLLAPRWARAGQAAIGLGLMAFVLVILAESIVDGNFGIDLPSFHAWLNDHNPRPGRMSLNSGIGFLFCGLALVLMQRVHSKARGVTILVATFGVFAIGLTGLVGYSLDLDLLYPWFHSSRMPLHTAASFVLAGSGLWLSWCAAEWYRSRRYFKEDEKVSFFGGAMLIVVALTAGVAGFSGHGKALERTLSENLASSLKSRITLFQGVLQDSFLDGSSIAARPDLIELMHVLNKDPANTGARARLQAIGQNLISPNMHGVAVYGVNNRQIMAFGKFSDAPEIAAELHGEVPATLFSIGASLYINSRFPITDRNKTIGFLAVEQALPLLTEQALRMEDAGQTGIIRLCIARPDHFFCFPQYRDAKAFRMPRHSPFGQPLPMNDAVEGKSGIFRGTDSGGRTIISAFGPVNASGLGMVIQQETQELYRPIREQLESTALLLFLLVVVGAWLLRLYVKPLATHLLRSEHEAKEREMRTRTVVDNVDEGIITVSADGEIESFNNAASLIFGYTREEAIGKNIFMVIPADMRAWHDEGMRRYLRGEAPHIIGKSKVELPGLRKTGAVFPLELTLNEMRIGEQRLFVGIVRDITRRKLADAAVRKAHSELESRVQERTAELLRANDLLKMEISGRKRIEEALRYTQEILTKAQAIAHLGNWEMDVQTGHMEWSDELFRIGGLEPRSVKPSLALVLSLLHPEDRDLAQQALADIVETGGSYRHEWRIVCADGSIKHVLSQGEVVYDERRVPVTLIGTFLDITEHKLAEEALKESQDKLRKIAAHQDRIKEEERKRIAREIHDELGGLLTGVKSYLSVAIDSAERAGRDTDRHLVEACGLVDSAIETARRVITDLRPSVLDQLGLWTALEWYAGQIEQRTGLTCAVEIDTTTAAINVDSERSTALFRIVQEALTNVVRHAHASHVTIRATSRNGQIAIELKDDGKGIEPRSLLHRESWGIAGMYERARYFGGELNIAGVAGQGTRVDLRMPMEIADGS